MDTTSLVEIARTHIARAREATHGRSARTVHGGHERGLRQTVVALRAGASLTEHQSLREATLQVLAGRIRLNTEKQTLEAAAGSLLPVPGEAHTVDAVEDSALLLTVAVGPEASGSGTSNPGHRSVYSWQEAWA